MLSIPTIALVGLALLATYKFVIYPAFISPLSKIPNAHWSTSISPLWIYWVRFQNCENRVLHAAHERHGPTIRLGPNEIAINSVDGGLRTIYVGGFEKGRWYSIFDNYGVPCTFSSLYSKTHSVRKRMISHVYSKSVIQSSPAFAAQAAVILYDRLLPILKASTDESQKPHGLDAHELWNASTMDFITAYQFGISHAYNFLQNIGLRQHWLALYQSRKKYTFFSQELPRLTKFCHAIGIRLVPTWVDDANRELEASCAKLCKSAAAAIKSGKTLENPADQPVVLNAVLVGIEKERSLKGSDSLLAETTLKETELSVASEMLDHLCAGYETSGITLTYLTWHLSHDLALQAALRSELKTLDHPVKYPASTTTAAIVLPNSKQLDSLPILHAVLMETLRLEAAIPGSQPRMSPYPVSELNGFEIPGGVRVSSAAHSLHRNPSVYPSPDTWDHTRWLETKDGEVMSPEAVTDRDRWFWAFSSGGRMCVGSNFAMHGMELNYEPIELKLVTAAIYTNFTSHIVNDDGIEQMDGYTCTPKSNRLYLRFEQVV